jgi:hypothetical protein
MTTKSAFSALGAPMSLAWVHESPMSRVLALPISVESGNLSFSKTGIRWMSVDFSEVWFSPPDFNYTNCVARNSRQLQLEFFSETPSVMICPTDACRTTPR